MDQTAITHRRLAARQFLDAEQDRLLARARSATAGQGGVRPEEFLQQVNEAFLVELARGWFDEAPRISLAAQARQLLAYLILRVRAAMGRSLRRLRREQVAADRPQAQLERIVDRRPSAEQDLVREAAHREHAEALASALAAVRAKVHPPRALALLASTAPEQVTFEDFTRSARCRRGGATFPVRRVEEAWALFREWRTRPPQSRCAQDLAEILMREGPLGSTSSQARATSAASLAAKVTRARSDLKRLRARS